MAEPMKDAIRCTTAVVLSVLLAFPLAAQAPPATPAKPPVTTATLQVLALAGEGETNDMQKRIMAPLVVQVLDLNSRPVEGADVTFRFPLGGPSASFADGQLTRTVRTNADGQAAATGWVSNSEAGPFRVRIVAARGSETGDAVVTMINGAVRARAKQDEPRPWWKSGWFKALLIGGAAGGITAGILATRSGPTPTSTVTPGGPVIGGVAP